MRLGGADEDGGVAGVVTVSVKVVAPEGMVSDGVEVVQGTPVGGKGGVAYAGEGGEDISGGKARGVVLVGFIAKRVMVVDTGV